MRIPKLPKTQKTILSILLVTVGFFVGNRIFNHVSAWAGVFIIIIMAIILIRLIYKYVKKL